MIEGALIVNYTGHGGLTGWSEERILDVPTIQAFDNIDRGYDFIHTLFEGLANSLVIFLFQILEVIGDDFGNNRIF